MLRKVIFLKTIINISNFSTEEKTFVTIGTFDGVHFGHQKILEKLVSEAKTAGKKSVLLTFSLFLTLKNLSDISGEISLSFLKDFLCK